MEKKLNGKVKAEKQLKELIEVAGSAVVGYEKYLLDEINYNDLARIMTNLRKYIPDLPPVGATGSNKK